MLAGAISKLPVCCVRRVNAAGSISTKPVGSFLRASWGGTSKIDPRTRWTVVSPYLSLSPHLPKCN